MASIHFHYADVAAIQLKDKRKIKQSVEALFMEERKALKELRYIFCTDEYLLQINRQFLQHDDYTDIITFNLSETKEVTGEIYISNERVVENAKAHGVSYQNEMLRVIFHGALHLCGYGDKSVKDKKAMTSKEDYYLARFPFI